MKYHLLLSLSLLTGLTNAQTVGGGFHLYHEQVGVHGAEQLGSAVADAGDVNGDGIHDYLFGAPKAWDGSIRNVGTVWVYSGADHSLIYEINGLQKNDRIGGTAGGVGDVNGDGFDDFFINTPESLSSYLRAATIVSGLDGTVLFSISGPFGIGFAVEAGDVNGDGCGDILASASSEDNGHIEDAGAVYLYSGIDGQLLHKWVGGFGFGRFGGSLAGGKDVDDDGVADFVFGNYQAGPGGLSNVGQVLVISGSDYTQIYKFNGTEIDAELGNSVSFAGDFDQDGFEDILVGEYKASFGSEVFAGAVHIYSGRTGAVLKTYRGQATLELFGSSVAGGQDLDGDGTADIVIGIERGGYGAGSVQVLSGADDSLIFEYFETYRDDGTGQSLAVLPDIHGDGRAELLVGRTSHDLPPTHWSVGWAGLMGWAPFLAADTNQISASAGGTVQFDLDFSSFIGSESYRLLGSARGIGPTNVGGVLVPLTPGDPVWNALMDSSPPPLFQNTVGTLDAQGMNSCSLELPGGAASSVIGRTFFFAAWAHDAAGVGKASSVAVEVTITP